MPGTLFTDTLRRDWRQVFYWGIGLAILAYYVIAVIPDVEALNRYADMLETMPPVLLNMFGVQDVASLTTPEGFVGFGFFTYALLVLAVFAVFAGLSITSNEEDAGIMDVVLSLPVQRWRLIVERFAAYTVLAAVITGLAFISLLVGNTTTAITIDNTRLLMGVINMLPSTLLVMAFTVFATSAVRRRALAVGLVVTFVIGSFFIDFLATAITHSLTHVLSLLSFFTYYDGQNVVLHGLKPDDVLVLLVVTFTLLVGAVWFFQRRDIGL